MSDAPTPRWIRPDTQNNDRMAIYVATTMLFQDIFGSASYDDVPEKHRITFNVIRTDRDGKRVYREDDKNRWIHPKGNRRIYKPEGYNNEILHYMNVEHHLFTSDISCFVSAGYDRYGDAYTSLGMYPPDFNFARKHVYEGHHIDYAKGVIEHAIRCYVAFEYQRFSRHKIIKRLEF